MKKNILPRISIGFFFCFVMMGRSSGNKASEISFSPCQATKLKMMLESAMMFLSNAQNFTETILVDEDKIDGMSICHHPMDCEDILNCGKKRSGIYKIWPINRMITDSVSVYCDMDTDGGGWTVFQRRGDFGQAKDFFFKDWETYKKGFGNLQADFWLADKQDVITEQLPGVTLVGMIEQAAKDHCYLLQFPIGNDLLFAISNQRLYSLRIDLEDFEGEEKYAFYETFWIDGEKCNYPLYIDAFNGTAGDSLSYHNGSQFTTKDRDNDLFRFANCAHRHKGGWWYKSCQHANLNGLYENGTDPSVGSSDQAVNWFSWKAYNTLAFTEMKIRAYGSSYVVVEDDCRAVRRPNES